MEIFKFGIDIKKEKLMFFISVKIGFSCGQKSLGVRLCWGCRRRMEKTE